MSDGYAVKVRPEKVEAIETIKTELGDTQAVVLTEYRGLTVSDLATLRAQLREKETKYRVVKNTLARRAVTDLGFDELVELFVGPVAVAYCKGDPVAAAKVLATFAREHPDLVIKGGVLEGRVISADEAKGLASVDSLDVSRAKIAGLLTAALRQIAMLAEAPARQILYVLEQVGARGEAEQAEREPEPAAETETTAEAEPEPETTAEPEPDTTAEAKPEPQLEEKGE
jgi:large subunit ribosomal protein L10